jgi:hypothetical protein
MYYELSYYAKRCCCGHLPLWKVSVDSHVPALGLPSAGSRSFIDA